MRWTLPSITSVSVVFVVALLFTACSGKSRKATDEKTTPKVASTRVINDPPWHVSSEGDEIVIHDEPDVKKPVQGMSGDAGVAKVEPAATPVDAAVALATPDAASKPLTCENLCEEARTCIARFQADFDCAKECARTTQTELDKAIKCRPELAKGCDVWMQCVMAQGG